MKTLNMFLLVALVTALVVQQGDAGWIRWEYVGDVVCNLQRLCLKLSSICCAIQII